MPARADLPPRSMGITPDGLPMVGNLPASVTGRSSGQEWMAAAFNGYGMDKAWLSGEAVVAMMEGRDVSAWFPSGYVVSDSRLASLASPADLAEEYWQMAQVTLQRRVGAAPRGAHRGGSHEV